MDHSSFLKKGGWERYLQIWKEYELDKEKSSVLWMRREEGCFISAHDGIRRLQWIDWSGTEFNCVEF